MNHKMRAMKTFTVFIASHELGFFPEPVLPGIVVGVDNQATGARRLRPLRRRRRITARPAGVDMRTRKPWVRARRTLLGW